MKPIGDMTAEELAGLVCHSLETAAVIVTLTGGTCVGIWSEGRYVSHDLDFVEEGPVRQIFEAPRQPYTQALLAASLDPDPVVQAARRDARQQQKGLMPA